MKFQDKVVIITGAGSGIGRATSLLYAQGGAQVIVSDIAPKGGEETVRLITEAGGKASFITANVAKLDEVENLINETVAQFGKIDIAVNNAGIGDFNQKKTAEHPVDSWDKVIAVNQTGVFYCMKMELQQMMKQGSGNIVNVSSVAGLRGLPNNLAYVASKHAVVGMTKTAAMEYAKHNIRVNAVCPVFTLTNLFQPQFFGDKAEKLKANIPMKRYGKVEEIAEAITWLSARNSSFVTGHIMPVDGGTTA
ncbi:SDR family NAD(P)-dependent oxidoreductase [Microscilla marina]|uniref:3-oxoacyl-acyl-carrier-protein reductase n=1 Tax=Microscilla marina ATCC 23134 TaxID=313606 RepID=A1ZCN1_MICM2|nr:glucose 1-dehydrogenase [Microscilla marina]EAY32033.1 3-oxoacyl-acyl-carrier-protein reductase [Microscilla marina ATCC 23134]